MFVLVTDVNAIVPSRNDTNLTKEIKTAAGIKDECSTWLVDEQNLVGLHQKTWTYEFRKFHPRHASKLNREISFVPLENGKRYTITFVLMNDYHGTRRFSHFHVMSDEDIDTDSFVGTILICVSLGLIIIALVLWIVIRCDVLWLPRVYL